MKKKKNLEKRKLPKYLIIIIIVFFLSFYLSYRFDIGGQLISVVEQNTTTSTTTTTVKPKLKVLVSNVVETTTTLITTNKTTTTLIIIKTTTTTTKSYKSSGGGGSSKTTTTIPKPVAKIIINEIMYNPPGSDDDKEWVEIYNNDTFDCDISDWDFFESGTNHRLTLQQGSMTIPVGTYAIITDNATNFLINHPSFNVTIIKSSFSLSNDGEYVALKDYSSNVVDDITYNSSYGGDGNNKTLERTGNDWCESLVDGGTPGFVNSVLTCAITTTTSTTTTTETTMTTELTTTIETTTPSTTTTTITTTSTTSTTTTTETTTTSSTSTTTTTIPIIADHVVISEVYYDPLNETCSEFVELYNPKNENVNISGWGIATPTSANDATIPSNSFIKSYGFYLITDGCWYTGRDNSTWSKADHNETITLRNDDGWIILKNNLGTTVDKVGWENATNYEENQTVDVDQGKSLERKPGYLNSTAGNGWDSDNNLEDFIIRDTPEPQNSTFVEI